MRIIGGALKGRRLRTPGWSGLRPTSDRLRETLFNILGPRVAGARVLDGYAGTGALGLEALSRGAAEVTFVERDPRAARLIGANVEHCGVADRCMIVRDDMRTAARRRLRGRRYDLVLLDPPYQDEALERTIAVAGGLLAEQGLLVVEHDRRRALPETAGDVTRTRDVRSGDSALAFFVKR